MSGNMEALDLFSLPGGMTFFPPNRKVFRTIDLARVRHALKDRVMPVLFQA
jgi:hypothetical protein